ncbi:hypothetical protein pb186bvf_003886 [Paramecium bursaria]
MPRQYNYQKTLGYCQRRLYSKIYKNKSKDKFHNFLQIIQQIIIGPFQALFILSVFMIYFLFFYSSFAGFIREKITYSCILFSESSLLLYQMEALRNYKT